MSERPQTLVIAFDGGGTRCRAAAHDGTNMVSVETGSANVSTDFDGAIGEILGGFGALAERLGCPVDALSDAPAFVGVAGVTGSAIESRMRNALPFRHVRITDDRLPALRGVLGRREGVLAHCGTGSFFAAQSGGAVRLTGGWGHVLGDEASAQWVGKTVLRLVLEVVDGRISPSALTERLLADLDGAPGIVRFAGEARPSEFGALAPIVTEHAASGDRVAEHVMQLGAGEIARAVRDIGWRPGQALCLTGGIGPHYLAFLPAEMRASVADPEGSPLEGAISLARDLAQEIARERG